MCYYVLYIYICAFICGKLKLTVIAYCADCILKYYIDGGVNHVGSRWANWSHDTPNCCNKLTVTIFIVRK